MRCTSIGFSLVFAIGGEKGCLDSPSKSEFSEVVATKSRLGVQYSTIHTIYGERKGFFQQRKRNDWMCVHFLVISVVIKSVGGPNGTRYLSPPVELVTAMPAVVQGDGRST